MLRKIVQRSNQENLQGEGHWYGDLYHGYLKSKMEVINNSAKITGVNQDHPEKTRTYGHSITGDLHHTRFSGVVVMAS